MTETERKVAAETLDEARRLGQIHGRFANHGLVGARTLVGVFLPLETAERVADLLDLQKRQEELGVVVELHDLEGSS